MTTSKVISKNPLGKWKTPHLSAFRDCTYKATQVCYGKGLSPCLLNMQKILIMGQTSFRLMTTGPFYLKCSI